MSEVSGASSKEIRFDPEREGISDEERVGDIVESREREIEQYQQQTPEQVLREKLDYTPRGKGLFSRLRDKISRRNEEDHHAVNKAYTNNPTPGIQARLDDLSSASHVPEQVSGHLSEAIKEAEDAQDATAKIVDFSQARRERVANNSNLIQDNERDYSLVSPQMGKVLQMEGATKPGTPESSEQREYSTEEEAVYQDLRQRSRNERNVIRREEEGKPIVERDFDINLDDKIEKSDRFRGLFFGELRKLRRQELRGELVDTEDTIEVQAWNNAKQKYAKREQLDESKTEAEEVVDDQREEGQVREEEYVGDMRVRDSLLREHQARKMESDKGSDEASNSTSFKGKDVDVEEDSSRDERPRFKPIERREEVEKVDDEYVDEGDNEGNVSSIGSRVRRRWKDKRPKLFERRAA